jgi:hypothetical protein
MAWMAIIGGALGSLGMSLTVVSQPSVTTGVILFDCVCSLITGLGLRARREWARRGFIFVLAYSALMGIVGAFRVRFPAVSDLPQPAGSSPSLTQEQLDAMTAQMRPVVVVMAFLSAVVSALLIAKLSSQKVRDEFGYPGKPIRFKRA